MAKVILDVNDVFVAASKVTILGNTGSETVKILDGASVTVDSAVERIEFARASSAYTYKTTPTGMQVLYNGSAIADVAGGKTLAFTDISAPVVIGTFNPITLSAPITLGGVSVPSIASPLTLGNSTPSVVLPIVTLSSSVETITETAGGNTVTYTATLTGGTSATALNIPFTVTGTNVTTADFGGAALTGNITISAGFTAGSITFTAAADTTTEGLETAFVSLSNTVAGITVNAAAVNTQITDTSMAPVGKPLPVGTTALGTATSVPATNAADVFTFDVAAARASIPNTQDVITGFSVANDVLRLDLPTATGVTTLASFLGVGIQGTFATAVEIGAGAGTLINFGSDANGDAVTILLAGILTPADVVVNII